ncbi:MAG TPA: hypothetical protein VIN04_11435 [Myxococcota bacterium]|jgi:hypothetical protein
MLRAALLVGFAGLLFLVPPPARAALVRVDVVGVIVSVAKDNGVPIPRWSFVVENETPFSAFFVYDDAQTDSDPLAQSGEFVYEGSPFFYQVEVGPYLFATDAFLLQVWNNVAVPGLGVDGQAVRGDDVVGTGDPMAPVAGRVVLSWGSDSLTAINDDALIPADELMNVFENALLVISVCPQPPQPGCVPMAEVVGVIEEVTVPEPAAGAASAAAIVALALASAWRRRGARGARSG